MSNTNPEIEASLDALADLVCQSMKGETREFDERRRGLLKTLLMSGYSWKSNETLMTDVEGRIKDQCGDKAMHRGGALSSITIKLGKEFEDLARKQSDRPKDESPAKGANISSATDA